MLSRGFPGEDLAFRRQYCSHRQSAWYDICRIRPLPARGPGELMRQIVPVFVLLLAWVPASFAQVDCEDWGSAYFFSQGTA